MKKDLHKLVAFLAMLLLPFSLFSQEYGQNLFESFENGIPANWSQECLSGDVKWVKETGGTMPTGAFDGDARVKFTANSTVTVDATTRLITPDLNTLGDVVFSKLVDPILVFAHAQDKWTNDVDVLRILYRTSADGKWNKLKEYDKYISKWTLDTLSLAVVQGSSYLQLAFEATDHLGRGVILDRVEVRSAPSCFAPDEIKVENISSDTAIIKWSGAWDVTEFSLKVSATELTEEQLADASFKADVLDCVLSQVRKHTIKNLLPDTKYYYYIRSNCFGEYSTWESGSFQTINYLTLPYYESFNLPSSPTIESRMREWYYGASEDSFEPYINTSREEAKYKHSDDTTFVLSFYGKHYYLDMGSSEGYMIPANAYSYAVMPALPENVDFKKLYMSFKTLRYENQPENYRIIVGMMENPRDINSFEAIDTIVIESVNVLEEPIVYFKDYIGKGRNIAFMSRFDVENCFNIDDLRLDYLTADFEKVNNFKIGIPTANSISIDFDIEYANYEVVLSTKKLLGSAISDDATAIRKIIANKGIIDGLTASQHYFVYVRATDGTNAGEWSNPRYVYMPGKIEKLPFMLGGDIDVNGTSTNPSYSNGNTYIYKVGKDIDKIINLPTFFIGSIPLFNHHSGPSYGAINASQNAINTAPTKFVNHCQVPSGVTFVPDLYSALVLPEVTDLDGTRITFYVEGLSDYSSIVTGFLSDANDISTFAPIDTINLNKAEGKHVFYDLGKYKGKGNFFVIYAATNDVEGKSNYSRFFLDNIEFVSMPLCSDPVDVEITPNLANPSEVTMTWDANGASAWIVRVSEQKYAPERIEDERSVYVFSDTVNTNRVTVTGLNYPKKTYYYTMRSTCSETEYGEWTYFESFETECIAVEKLPYTEDFNSYAAGNSKEFTAPCFGTQVVYNPYLPNLGYYPQIIREGALVMANTFKEKLDSYIAFPKMERPVNELQISFDVEWRAINSSVSVGVMTDPYDSLSFVEVDRIKFANGRVPSTVRYVVTLNDYAGKGEYIALSTNDANDPNGEAFRIDNVVIEVINTCGRPDNISIEELSSDTVKLNWESFAGNSKWAVLLSSTEMTASDLAALDSEEGGKEEDTPLLPESGGKRAKGKDETTTLILRIDTVETNPAVIRDLTPNTTYYVYIRTLCGEEASLWSNVFVFTSSCAPIVPNVSITETFDLNMPYDMPTCYIVGNATGTDLDQYIPSCIDEFKHSGTVSLKFESTATGITVRNGAYAIAPRIDIDDIRNLNVTFWGAVGDPILATDIYAHSIIVGVITDPFNLATFEPVDTLTLDVEWRPYEVSFANYEGDYRDNFGKYVMFTSDFELDNKVYVDDITFTLKSDCHASVDVYNITDKSVNVDVTGQAPYQVVYVDRMMSNEELAALKPIDIEKGNSTTIDNLQPSTSYYVYARSSCGKELWSDWSVVEVVRTNCIEKATLPFAEDFEKNIPYGEGSSPLCWVSYNTLKNAKYPQINSVSRNGGERSVLLVTESETEKSYIVSHEFDVATLKNAMVSFYASPYTLVNPSVIVGIVENIDDIANSFVVIDTVLLASDDWKRYEVSFANYTGAGKRIAFVSDFVLNQRAGGYLVDDILVEVVPVCARPFDFEFVAHTDTSLTVSFTHNKGFVKCEIIAGVVGFDPELKGAGIVTEGTATIVETKGLVANTEYDLYVRTFCSEKEASPWTFAGRYSTTQDYVRKYPYSCNFQDKEEIAKWSFVQGGQTDRWYIGNDTSNAVSETADPTDKALYVSYDGGLSMKYFNTIDSSTLNSGLSPQSYSWAYRTLYFESGIYNVSYKWTCTGGYSERGGMTDYMKVLVVPSTATLFGGEYAIVRIDGQDYPLYASTMDRNGDIKDVTGYTTSGSNPVNPPIIKATLSNNVVGMQGNDNWLEATYEVLIEEAGMYNMAFAWVNQIVWNDTQTIIRSGAIDDITIDRQSCSAPYELEKTSFGHNTSDFVWKSVEEKVEYIVKVTGNTRASFEELTDADFVFVDTVLTKSVTAKNLAPSSSYNIYVATRCGADDVSSWSEPLFFETVCAPFKVDSVYDFNEGLPQCFITGHTNSAYAANYTPRIYTDNDTYIASRTTGENGGGAINFSNRSYYYQSGGYVVLPMFESDLKDLTLTFWMRCILPKSDGTLYDMRSYLGTNYARSISVGTMTDPNDPNTFKRIEICTYPYGSSIASSRTKNVSDDPTGNDYWVKFIIPLKDAEGQFIVFKDEDYRSLIASKYSKNAVYIDDIEVSSKTCVIPTDVTFKSIKKNSAVVNFNGESVEYQIEVATDNQFANKVTSTTVKATSYTIENLNKQTQYFVRIKGVCDAFDQSDWSPTATFTTLQGVVYDETFSEQLIAPNGWLRVKDLRVSTAVATGNVDFEYLGESDRTGWTSTTPLFDNSGRFSTRHMSVPSSNITSYWLISPTIDLDDAAKYHLSFDMAFTGRNTNLPIDEDVKADVNNRFVVIVSEDGGKSWKSENMTVWGANGEYSLLDVPNTGASYSVDLTKFAGKSVTIAFCSEGFSSTGIADIHLDNIHVNVFTDDESKDVVCESMDYENDKFYLTSDVLKKGENEFTTWTLTSEPGKADICHKLVLNVTEMKVTYLPKVELCEGSIHNDAANGFTNLSKTGQYKRKLRSCNACDSVVILDVNVLPRIEESVMQTICKGQTITWNGKEYNRSGVYTETLTSQVTGCDSIVTLVLTVNDSIRHTEYVNICYGESYDFAGTTITETGEYRNAFKTVDGCDSVVILKATVLSDYTNIVINDVIAEGEVYNKNGFVGLTKPGSYKLPMKSEIGGCDSIVILNLVVGDATHYQEVRICHGATYQFGSQTIDKSGQYIETFSEDSVVLLNATVLPDYRQILDTIICKGEVYNANGFENKTESGTYTLPLTSVDGCDSTITLNLKVINGDTTYVEERIKQDELPYEYMNLYYGEATEPGTYVETIVIEAENCKDVIVHTLIVDIADAIDNVNTTDLTLIPNPVKANNTLYVEVEFSSNERKDMFVEVFNAIGQCVFVDTPTTESIQITGLNEAGVYVVRIITGTGTIYQGKVVVQ